MKNSNEILIKNALLNNESRDILIKDNIIFKIGKELKSENIEKVIDGRGKAVTPSFVNGHSHAAMTIFRGYADDMALDKWLREKIWPLEASLTEEDVYWGVKLACLEMIKSGTTFFNDMYWHFNGTKRAVKEMGLRAAIGEVVVDFNDLQKRKEQIHNIEKLYSENKDLGRRINFALTPHSIYAASKEMLQWIYNFSKREGLMIHIHVSETEKEVKDCLKMFGKRPIEYLESIGFLSSKVVIAHAVWLDEKELDICKKYDVSLVYNPISNMKLVSGIGFPYKEIREKKIKLAFGTDGSASSNNLDMFEVMKMACLIQKSHQGDSEIFSAQESFAIATKKGAEVFNLNAGEIKEGKLADLLLIDLNLPDLTPNHNLISNLVYSANGSCVDTVICDGQILMENRKVEGEEEILIKAREVAQKVVK